MKTFRILSLAIALAASLCASAQDAKEQKKAPADTFAICDIRDLALIYQGGAHRIDWTPEEFTPYVTHVFADGTEDWLFDGYQFLEFKDGKGVTYSPGYDKINARRSDWEWYLDRLFEKGKSLSALDQVIAEKKKTLGDPGFRHKVVLTVLVPMRGQTDWGEVDGRKLDFNNVEDQKIAAHWFIDQLTSRFKKEGYKNLDLYGLYWIDEDMVNTNDFPRQISEYVHGKNLKFIWIPYFKAPGHDRWRELGFDIAYHQPNHFFNDFIPDTRLDEAIDIALENGMAMEYECDVRALSQAPEKWAHRMDAYSDAYERRGVYDRSALAYYTDSHLLLDFVRQPSPENQRLADRLARHIVNRRANRDIVK